MKVLTVSRFFPAGHPKAGQPTWFVPKIWNGLRNQDYSLPESITKYVPNISQLLSNDDYLEAMTIREIKLTTIRAGNRFKPGDMVSLRVWSEKPYRSKQIEFAQVEVKRTISVTIHVDEFLSSWVGENTNKPNSWNLLPLCEVAKNDGLQCDDFVNWFKIHPKKNGDSFIGQIIIWSPCINY